MRWGFPPALTSLRQRHIEVAPLVDRVLPLAKALEAFDRAGAPGVLKVLVQVE